VCCHTDSSPFQCYISVFTFPFKFVPDPVTTAKGTYGFNTKWGEITMEGSGSYMIKGADTEKPRIIYQGSANMTGPQMPTIHTVLAGLIDLVPPLDTDECKP